MKTDIRDRTDVGLLVRSFYNTVRRDDLIGPIFNAVIPLGHWEAHFEKLTDFWEGNLFFKPTYSGKPVQQHQAVSRQHHLGEVHFQRWLQLWHAAVTAQFDGPVAQDAHDRAESIARILLFKLLHPQTHAATVRFESRPSAALGENEMESPAAHAPIADGDPSES